MVHSAPLEDFTYSSAHAGSHYDYIKLQLVLFHEVLELLGRNQFSAAMPVLEDEIVSFIAVSFKVCAQSLLSVAHSVTRDVQNVGLLPYRVLDAVFGGNPALEQDLPACFQQCLLDLLCFSLEVKVREQEQFVVVLALLVLLLVDEVVVKFGRGMQEAKVNWLLGLYELGWIDRFLYFVLHLLVLG